MNSESNFTYCIVNAFVRIPRLVPDAIDVDVATAALRDAPRSKPSPE
jgi:hypothetical protein